jgi:hypothetical protein
VTPQLSGIRPLPGGKFSGFWDRMEVEFTIAAVLRIRNGQSSQTAGDER